ncbi:efflux RND transporter periplasmic adaptor subunit [Membranihabitans maritimus]|uniref:efflux RND transporter periplasmic adaptor subunit n=1 Tax=Membranihabitans maritimus TaxID=2904244 RepID=UPI001F0188BB|nr:efflux RND transporter periplasmic adaptor subunit [Membranihabitans maritimus]
MMKYLNFIALVVFFLSCQPNANEESGTSDINSMDVAQLKALLNEKKSQVQGMEAEIDSINKRLEDLGQSMGTRKEVQVTVLPIKNETFKHYISIQGSLQADDVIAINSEVNGRVVEFNIEEGDYIKQGDLVAVLDMESLNKQMAEIEKSYELAKDVFERQKRLWDQEIGSEVQYLQAKNEKERLEKSIETLEYQKSQGNVYAPVSGIVDEIYVHLGEIASPGAPIANILDVRRLIAKADVPENYLGSVQTGDVVDVYYPSLDFESSGRVVLIGNKIDAANRTFKVEVVVPRSNKNLKPNLLTEIKINDKTEEDVVVIPINVIQQEINGKEYVMIADTTASPPVARKAYIERGDSSSDEVVVESGLTPGMKMIHIGSRTVGNGDPIKIIDQAALPDNENTTDR